MGIQKFLDLTGIDVLPSPNDHIFDAPDDINIALFIHRCQVTCMHPARLVNGSLRRLGIIPVAQHNAIATRTQFSWYALRHDLTAFRIDDLDFEMRMNLAHCGDALLKWRIEPALHRN